VNSELEGYEDQLLSIRQDAPGILAGLTGEDVNRRPAPDRWSIGECFSHLNLTAKRSIDTIDEAIAGGRARGLTAGGPFVYPLLERLFVRSLEPPPRFRARARKFLEPAPRVNAEEVLREFVGWQDRFNERLRRADGLDLRRVRVQSPVVSWLRYSLGTAIASFLAHERRHLWQARRVRQEIEAQRLHPPASRTGRGRNAETTLEPVSLVVGGCGFWRKRKRSSERSDDRAHRVT
jgi:hypothetical protein